MKFRQPKTYILELYHIGNRRFYDVICECGKINYKTTHPDRPSSSLIGSDIICSRCGKRLIIGRVKE